MPQDIWIRKSISYKAQPGENWEYIGYGSYQEAKDEMEVGDELSKIPAEHQEYLGTLKQELVK